MATRKLNYRFHDPNPPAAAVNLLLQICLEANRAKVEAAIQRTVPQTEKPLHTEP